MHFRLRSISMFFSLGSTFRYLMSIAFELLIDMTPRRCSPLKTLLVLRDKLLAISSMEFPARRDSTSRFSSAWLHRLLAMTGLWIWASWYSASESFSIAKRNASWVSDEKNFDFSSAISHFFDSELFIQISSVKMKTTTTCLEKTPYTLPVSNVCSGFDWTAKHTSVKSLYAYMPPRYKAMQRANFCILWLYYKYTTLLFIEELSYWFI